MSNEFLNEDRLTEVDEKMKEMSVILHMPYESNLLLLYTVTEARSFLCKRNAVSTKERIDAINPLLDDASVEVRHLYHRTVGSYHINVTKDLKGALNHYLQALSIGRGELKLEATQFSALGNAYMRLCKPIRAISYFEMAMNVFGSNRGNTHALTCKGFLSSCYMMVNELKRAKELTAEILENTLNSTKHAVYYRLSLVKMALICQRSGNPEECLKLLEQSHKYANDSEQDPLSKSIVFSALSTEAEALLDMRKYSRCKEAAEKAIQLTTIDNVHHHILFGSYMKLASIRDSGSTDYIENVTIPYLTSSGDIYRMYDALYFCDKLKAHYINRGADKKALAMGNLSGEIFRKMICGPDDIN